MLRIIAAQQLMIGECSVDSFICGFRLAWELANKQNHYMEEHPEPEEISDPGVVGQFNGDRLNPTVV